MIVFMSELLKTSNCVWVKWIATHAALLSYYFLALFFSVRLAL